MMYMTRGAIASLSAVVAGSIFAAVAISRAIAPDPSVEVRTLALQAAPTFIESFTGAPGAPLNFESDHWEMSFHPNWTSPTEGVQPSDKAHHTAACGSPGETGTGRHSVSLVRELVYNCSNHIMTHLPAGLPGSYGVLYMTPDAMVDLNGTATVKFDVSTFASSTRDWIDVWVQDWNTQEQKVLDTDVPTNQGNPRNAVHVEMGGSCGTARAGEGQFHLEVFDANRSMTCTPGAGRWIDVLTPSAITRSTIQIDMTRTHVKVWMPQNGLVFVEADIPQLPFTEGVVSLGHHSYAPEKGAEGGNLNGDPDSWHWDEVAISPSVPFAIIHSDHRGAFYDEPAAARTFIFDRPAPANSMLRFEGYGDNIMASFDNGAFGPVARTGQHLHAEHASSYFTPVPTGASRVTLRVDSPGFGFVGEVAEVNVFSKVSGGTPTPTVTPTATPTATQTGTPTATPPSSTTITFNDAPGQNVALSGNYGGINWGSNQWFLSAPWSVHTSKSVSFNTNATSKTFAFTTPKVLESIKAGGVGVSTITLSCSGNPTKTQAIPANALVTITTGWVNACTTVTIGSSNGWDTNFDDLVVH